MPKIYENEGGIIIRIEKEGYEFNGVKLGDKVLYRGQETVIIGFDEDDEDESFIAVENVGDHCRFRNSSCATVSLKGCGDMGYDWVSIDRIEIPESEDNPSPQISPIHAKEIMDDISVELTELQARITELIEINKQCMSILNNNTN